MQELQFSADVQALPSLADVAQLRRRHWCGGSVSVRKNVCFITLNGSWNGASFLNFGNGFGGF
jgi:hypothetical protein